MTLRLSAVVLGLLGGAALGALFFWGLWLTVGRAVGSSRPIIWLAGSAAVRFAFAVAGFYGLSLLGGDALVAGVAGFLVARQAWLAAKRGGRQGRPAKEREEV